MYVRNGGRPSDEAHVTRLMEAQVGTSGCVAMVTSRGVGVTGRAAHFLHSFTSQPTGRNKRPRRACHSSVRKRENPRRNLPPLEVT